MVITILNAVFAGYLVVSAFLMFRTWGHYKTRRFPGTLDLLRPELYSEEGLHRRRTLIRFCVYGGIAVVLLLLAVNRLVPEQLLRARR